MWRAHFNAQVTFVAWEVFAEVQRRSAHELSPMLLRRNIVVEGIPSTKPSGRNSPSWMRPAQECASRAPATAHPARMDAALGAGAWQLLQGRRRAACADSDGWRAAPVRSGADGVALDASTITAPRPGRACRRNLCYFLFFFFPRCCLPSRFLGLCAPCAGVPLVGDSSHRIPWSSATSGHTIFIVTIETP